MPRGDKAAIVPAISRARTSNLFNEAATGGRQYH
jgi:hypothetical protein